jgi:chromosome segregation ATPase
MTDIETLAERLRTVERAVTDGTMEFPEVTELAGLEKRVETVEQRVDDIDERTGELEAATQALRGYVGNIRAVNEDVEQRADAALAATDRLEVRLDEELGSQSASDPPATSAEQRRTATTQGRQRSLDGHGHTDTSATTGLAAEEQTDFSAITDGSGPDSDESETAETGVFGRIRSLL